MNPSPRPDDVVVGVADLPTAADALAWAAREAARRDVRLVLLHAVHHALLEEYPHRDRELVLGVVSELLQDARRSVLALAPDLDVVVHIVHGGARRALLDSAHQAALLVLGARGRGGAQGLDLGSTVSWVAARSPVPTVVVRGASAQPPSGVVVGVDGSSEAGRACVLGAAWAHAADRPLTVLHCWDELSSYRGLEHRGLEPGDRLEPGRSTLADRHDHLLTRSLAALEAELGAAGLGAPTEIRGTVVAAARIADVLLAQAADGQTLVLGVRGSAKVSGAVLGSVARAVLHRARAPVVLVPRAPDDVDDHVVTVVQD